MTNPISADELARYKGFVERWQNPVDGDDYEAALRNLEIEAPEAIRDLLQRIEALEAEVMAMDKVMNIIRGMAKNIHDHAQYSTGDKFIIKLQAEGIMEYIDEILGAPEQSDSSEERGT